jgi:hypothetical protein
MDRNEEYIRRCFGTGISIIVAFLSAPVSPLSDGPSPDGPRDDARGLFF